jgi:outer membrane protein assembly factor BamB
MQLHAKTIFLLPLLVAAQSQAPWPLPRADMQRSGCAPFEGPSSLPPLAWSQPQYNYNNKYTGQLLLGPLGPVSIVPAPAIPSTQTVQLRDFSGNEVVTCSPFASDGFDVSLGGLGPNGRVYALAVEPSPVAPTSNSQIYALDTSPSSCSVAWSSNNGTYNSILALDSVIVGMGGFWWESSNEVLLGFSPSTGYQIWGCGDYSNDCSLQPRTAVLYSTYIMGIANGGAIRYVALADGTTKTFANPSTCEGSPNSAVLRDSTYFFASYSGDGSFCVAALSLATGVPALLWNYVDAGGGGSRSALTLVGSFLAFIRTGVDDNHLGIVILSQDTGELYKFVSTNTARNAADPVADANNLLFLGSPQEFGPTFQAIDPFTGENRWVFPAKMLPPSDFVYRIALSQGLVVAMTTTSMIALGGVNPSPPAPPAPLQPGLSAATVAAVAGSVAGLLLLCVGGAYCMRRAQAGGRAPPRRPLFAADSGSGDGGDDDARLALMDDRVSSMTVSQLRAALARAGVDTRGVVEKWELVELARGALN